MTDSVYVMLLIKLVISYIYTNGSSEFKIVPSEK
jgi:hypothetical protein